MQWLRQISIAAGSRTIARRRLINGFLALTLALLPLRAFAAGDLAEIFARHDAKSTAAVDHAAFGKLLAAYVRPGPDGVNRVAYAAFKAKDHRALRAYLGGLQRVAVTKLNRAEQFAYWVNLYNAATLDVVLAHYPVASIRDIAISPGLFAKGPWGKKIVRVEGTELSLDDIEHKILRPLWRDPRIHYTVNCASVGCPDLARVPYTAAKLEAMLDAAARTYVNHPRGAAVRNGSVVASSIYKWYGKDFGDGDRAILEHIRRYAAPALAQALATAERIGNYDYDWRLNDASE